MAFGERNNETLSQINVTPLVDVMLVLLVIFMVTAPILQQGVSVDLPQVKAGALASDEVQLVVSVAADGALFLNDTALTSDVLREKLVAILRDQPDKQVFLRADRAARYGAVMEVLAALRGAEQEQRIDGVTVFVGEDATGSFSLLARHARFLTALEFGLAPRSLLWVLVPKALLALLMALATGTVLLGVCAVWPGIWPGRFIWGFWANRRTRRPAAGPRD